MIARWTERAARRPRLSALLLGALSALALPPIHALPVLWVALPGLWWLLGGRTAGQAAWIGFLFGLGHHTAGLYWITEAILIEAASFWWLVPIGVPMLAAVLALFLVPCTMLAARVPAGARMAALAGGWTLMELARQFVLSGFPWNPPGSVWAMPGAAGDVMIQPAALVGVHGLTLLTLLVGLAPAAGRRGWALALLGLAAWVGFGVWRLAPSPAAPGAPAVIIVQGNIAQEGKWERERALRHFRAYLDLTAGAALAVGDRPHVVVWPETASPFLVDQDGEARRLIAEAARGAALVGSIRFDAARRPFNSLVAVLGPGPAAATYDKFHLVPFGEYQPWWFPLPIAFVSGDGFGRGGGPEIWRLPGVPAVGPLICYEAIFPGQVVGADRPDWLVNVTNDAWFGNSTGPRQHLAAARLRAVEEGLPLARAANTGISALFDGYGRELGRLGMGQAGTVILDLPPPLPATLFARLGLWVPALLAVVTLLCVIFQAVRGRGDKFSRQSQIFDK